MSEYHKSLQYELYLLLAELRMSLKNKDHFEVALCFFANSNTGKSFNKFFTGVRQKKMSKPKSYL